MAMQGSGPKRASQHPLRGVLGSYVTAVLAVLALSAAMDCCSATATSDTSSLASYELGDSEEEVLARDASTVDEQTPPPEDRQPTFKHDGDYIYWNEITGEMQDTDPGGVPFEGKDGQRYWLDGARLVSTDPQAYQYVWVELYSEEQGREFFLNQETQQSTWGRPVDLAWRLVKRPTDKYGDF